MSRKRESLQTPLSPDMHSELDILRPVPPPDPAALQAGRAAFMEQVRALAPQAPADQTGPSELLPRRWGWRGISLLRRVPLLAVIEIILAFGLLVGGAMGAAYVSQESLPGALLYPLKLQLEDWQYAWLDDPNKQAEFAMDKAQERVEEVAILTVRGEVVPEQVVTRYQAQLELALGAMEALDEAQRETARAHIAAQLSAQGQVMERTQALMEPGAAGPVQTLLSVIKRAQDEIGAPEDDPASSDPDDLLPVLTPSPSPTVTFAPTATATRARPTATATATRARSTVTPTPTPTATRIRPTSTATPAPTSTATPAPPPTTASISPPTATPTPIPTMTFTPFPIPSDTSTPTSTPPLVLTDLPTPVPTPVLTGTPTSTPTPVPTGTPTSTPTPVPTGTPTSTPTPVPTDTFTPTFTATPGM